MSVGIVGLGLIGGSFARAVQAYTEHRVYGLDTEEVLAAARADGVISGTLTPERLGQVDVLILCLYPGQIVEFLQQNAAGIAPGTLVFDCAGVKEPVCAAAFPLARAHGFDFLGGHPMAGIEKSGYRWSRRDLFQGASMIFVPPEGADAALQRASDFVRRLGFGRITVTTARHHDQVIAYTSQLAHVVSSAYIKSPTAASFAGFSAGSFRDMTRVAFLNADMWTELFFDNQEALIRETDTLMDHLQQLRNALAENDRDTVHSLLEQGRRIKEELGE